MISRIIVFVFAFFWMNNFAQEIENSKYLNDFSKKLNENKTVTKVLFLGDSHIQAGWIPNFLRQKFSEKYGNAGRGFVFPYSVANSNGPMDITSFSDQAWQTFRLVYEQDFFKQMGALGFVMGNRKKSFIEINFNNTEDSFDEVKILNDSIMNNEHFAIYQADNSLEKFVKKNKNTISYQIQKGETWPELAAKFNTTTTKLVLLNGESVKNPQAGKMIKVEQVEPNLDTSFENKIKLIGEGKFNNGETVFDYPSLNNRFLIRTNTAKENIFYGFEFLKKNATSGVVFNSIGVNGATFSDFLKYPLQMEQLQKTKPDLVIISLGTNESVSSITKEDFQNSVKNLINVLRKGNENVAILLIAPTDNKMKPKKVKQVVDWIEEASDDYKVAFLNQYKNMGGTGYFQKALFDKKANADGIHFLEAGYNDQAEKIWKAFGNSKIVNK